MIKLNKIERRLKRRSKIRTKIQGTKNRPRISIFRSLRHIYVQLIDDNSQKTIISAWDGEVKIGKKKSKTSNRVGVSNKDEMNSRTLKDKELVAYKVGELIAKKAQEKKVKKVVFDRSGYKYHGRVKALACGVRKGGLEF